MSDDIPTRLRMSARARSKWYDRERRSDYATPLVSLLHDAADEIERLRSKLKEKTGE